MKIPSSPMLAAKVEDEDVKDLQFPLFASPKLDGVRGLVGRKMVYSRSLKPLPNKYLQEVYAVPAYAGMDGEFIVGSPTEHDCYRRTMKAVMTVEGTPTDLRLYVFDHFLHLAPFHQRISELKAMCAGKELVKFLPHVQISGVEQLEQLEQEYLDMGYEGIMLRHLNGPYKEGRSTFKEGYLLKLKRFLDSEAVVIGMTELQHNENEQTLSPTGHKVRSSHKANKVGGQMMGNLIVWDTKTKVEFEIGTGFTVADRLWWWERRDMIKDGQFLVKYKYFPVGVKEKPRHPVYLGQRDWRDMTKNS